MSGHSKWATIKRKKGAADAKRGQAFSKLSKTITVCAREGGTDPVMNFSLRLAIEKAKAANMPKDNIERAIQKAAGTGEGGQLATAVYEAMGPGGVAIVIEALTDNPNRTVTNVKNIVNKRGGNVEAKVLWMFERKGVAYVEDVAAISDWDSFELSLIDAGAEDIARSDDQVRVISSVKDLKAVTDALTASGLTVESAGIEYVAKNTTELSAEQEEKLQEMVEALEEDEDVNGVYTNAA